MSTEVTRNGDRFEIHLDGQRAGLAQFTERDGRRIFFHTEVGEAWSGQGLAAVLVAQALDATRSDGLRVVPVCPYVKKFLGEHDEEYGDLVEAVTREDMAAVRAATAG